MEFVDERTIRIGKVLNELDKLVLKFIDILEKYSSYVIISGYVALLFGRSRATEDVDVFVPELGKETFASLYNDLKNAGFWCLNGESLEELYEYLADGLALRFALENAVFPNFEVKFAKKQLDREALNDTVTVVTSGGNIMISSVERQIAFKKYFLKSEKDLEDAEHIENVFKEHINFKKVEQYRRVLEHGTNEAWQN